MTVWHHGVWRGEINVCNLLWLNQPKPGCIIFGLMNASGRANHPPCDELHSKVLRHKASCVPSDGVAPHTSALRCNMSAFQGSSIRASSMQAEARLYWACIIQIWLFLNAQASLIYNIYHGLLWPCLIHNIYHGLLWPCLKCGIYMYCCLKFKITPVVAIMSWDEWYSGLLSSI